MNIELKPFNMSIQITLKFVYLTYMSMLISLLLISKITHLSVHVYIIYDYKF